MLSSGKANWGQKLGPSQTEAHISKQTIWGLGGSVEGTHISGPDSPLAARESLPSYLGMTMFQGCGVGGVRAGTWWSYMNPPSCWAFFRTSSNEDPAGTEMKCLYGGQTLGTFSVTWMTSGTWLCEKDSTVCSNMTAPGRQKAAAGVRA